MKITIEQAIQKLQHGDVVAVPTETVYGLAAVYDNLDAVRKVFQTKSRPDFDPLIVHVSSVEMAKELIQSWDQNCQRMAEHFWPGPLTIVAEKTSRVSDEITSGLTSVAVRWPRHQMLQEIIEKLGRPIVAPSANMFGQVSPTTANHVLEEFENQVSVVDGGACELGIESTVVKSFGGELKILRPGHITPEAIAVTTDVAIGIGEEESSPGHLKDHYQPKKPLKIVGRDDELSEGIELVLNSDPRVAARQLYRNLRDLDKTSAEFIFVRRLTEMDGSYWMAVWNRLEKASSKN